MRILLITLISLLYFPLQGQGIIDEMAESACACMTKKGIEGKDAKAVEDLMQKCLIEGLLPRLEEMQKELNVAITDEVAMQGVGEKIGLKMATICPTMMLAMVDKESNDKTTSTSIKGKITKIENGDFVKLLIEDESGRTFNLLWLRSFEGDTTLIEMGENAVGKSVTLEFTEISCYSVSTQKYIAKQEITRIVFQ